MRELNLKERDFVSGGSYSNPQKMPPVTVTGTIPPSNSGDLMFIPVSGTLALTGGGGGGGGGGSGGIPVSGTTLKQEIENGIEAMAKELSLAKFGADVLGPELQAAQAANFAQETMTITMNDFQRDFQNYTTNGDSGDVSAQGSLLPWQKFDWYLVDPQQNMTENQVIERAEQLTSQGVNVWDLK